MTCSDVQRELDAYRTGEVVPGRLAAIDGHLAGCAECRRARDDLGWLATALVEMPREQVSRRLYSAPAPAGPRESPIYLSAVASPVGRLQVGFRGRRIVAVGLAGGDDAQVEERLARRFGRPVRQINQPPDWVEKAIAAAFAGRRARYLPIDLSDLSAFDRAVLEKAREIPPGEVRTYAWIAREIGRPGAVRAVGTALGQNPVPFLIPCHRVVRSDLSLGGYAFGSSLKQDLLAREGLPPDRFSGWSTRGVRFEGCRTTRIFCFPNCATGRRMKPANLVAFRTAADAAEAGFRPCKVCRPAPQPQAS